MGYSKISRAGLDGSSPEEIVTNDLHRPASLAVDPSQDSIYWVDSGSKTIESSKADGSQRRVLLKDMSRRPFGIAVYQVSANNMAWDTVVHLVIFFCENIIYSYELFLYCSKKIDCIYFFFSNIGHSVLDRCKQIVFVFCKQVYRDKRRSGHQKLVQANGSGTCSSG